MKARQTPLHARDYVEAEIDELKAAHVIGKTLDSLYGFPLVIVSKKTGGFRSCCDFRSINKVTAVPQYPMPYLEDMVAAMRNKPYLAVIDMAKAFTVLEGFLVGFTCNLFGGYYYLLSNGWSKEKALSISIYEEVVANVVSGCLVAGMVFLAHLILGNKIKPSR